MGTKIGWGQRFETKKGRNKNKPGKMKQGGDKTQVRRNEIQKIGKRTNRLFNWEIINRIKSGCGEKNARNERQNCYNTERYI